MGVVSSALYRYFPTRDDLLTALIVDAYNDLGEFAERAALRVPRLRNLDAPTATRLRSAIRKWAKSSQRVRPALRLAPFQATKAPQFTVRTGRPSRAGSRFNRRRRVAAVQL